MLTHEPSPSMRQQIVRERGRDKRCASKEIGDTDSHSETSDAVWMDRVHLASQLGGEDANRDIAPSIRD
jgi:hypothetical protein